MTGEERPKLLIDAMCGTLATYLRMCGYDAAYALDRGIEAGDRLLDIAAAEGRTLLTRDRELAERADDSVLLTERDVVDQLRELERAGYPIELPSEPRYCGSCNGRVDRVTGGESEGRPEYVPDDVDPVWRCRECGQWFWKGSHWERVSTRIETL